MSELLPTLSCEETLRRIRARLSAGAPPTQVIEELLPRSRDSALSWARRLAVWEEYRPTHAGQAIALARLISRRGMREFGLALREDGRIGWRVDGRVVGHYREGKPWKTPKPALSFRLDVGGEEVRVEYTPAYFPGGDTDLLYFVSPHDPPQPHRLSETGHWSHLAKRDAVEACGGPRAYAVLLADAVLGGREQELIAVLEGGLPKADPPRRHKAARRRPTGGPPPPPDGHADRVIAEEETPGKPPQQGLLF